jgi:7,8-dihydropterin-6-yl-methyl-4-(beta-D-ribofuranosyl)aminobenzene 5'-phosphate synthase
MKRIIMLIPLVAIGLLSISFPGKTQKITILYDNYIHKTGCTADWGFSCIIDLNGKSILFDTGTKEDIFFHNINELDVDLSRVNKVVISHNHADHTGNLMGFLKQNNKVLVYMPYSTPSRFLEEIRTTGAKVINEKDPVDLENGYSLTGELGKQIGEQSLIMDTPKGLVVVTGCSHPGIVNIVKRAKELRKKDIYLVVGGFHLMNHSDSAVKEIIQEFRNLGIKKVSATHCTGDKAIQLFKEAYGDDYIPAGVGKVFEF